MVLLLTRSGRSGTFAGDHVLVAIVPFILDVEICGPLVNPACAIFIVVVHSDAVLVLHTSILARGQRFWTSRVSTRGGRAVVDRSRDYALWSAKKKRIIVWDFVEVSSFQSEQNFKIQNAWCHVVIIRHNQNNVYWSLKCRSHIRCAALRCAALHCAALRFFPWWVQLVATICN